MNNFENFRKLSDAILVLIIGVAVWIHSKGFTATQLGEPYDAIITSIISVFSYELIVRLGFLLFRQSTTLARIYWGKKHLAGLWYYTSQDDQGGNNLGIWKFEQDLFVTNVSGFRLDGEFNKVSTVNSVSDVLIRDLGYEVINRRTDWDHSKEEYFSRTFLRPDEPGRKGLFKYPTTMRGETIIYGGALNNLYSGNAVFVKSEDTLTEAEILTKLQNIFFYDQDDMKWKRRV